MPRPRPVRFGVEMPQHLGYRHTAELAVAIERLGYDSVWIRDHLIVSPFELTQFQHAYIGADGQRAVGRDYLGCVPTMAAVAAITERVLIGSDILNLPRRNPVDVANEIATVDQISGGRVIFQAAIGQPVRDWAASGVRIPFAERGAVLEEALEVLRALWTSDEPVTFSGRWFDIEQARLGSRPIQSPHPPIWLGVERTLARVGRLADGFTLSGTMFGGRFDAYQTALETVQREAKRVGRDPDAIEPAARFSFVLDDDVAAAQDRGAAHWGTLFGRSEPWHREWSGNADTILGVMRPWLAAGVRHILLWPVPYASFEEQLRDLAYFAENVIPRLRSE